MSTRPFLPYPDKRLKTAVPAVTEITDDIHGIWRDMVETMDAMPGYGLAGPQIGVMQQLAVVDCSTERGKAVLMANPTIVHASAKLRDHEEASPNLPGMSAVISRPRAVTVTFLNAQGVQEERDFVDLWATSVQHQIDHLNGKMFFDHLKSVKRQMFLKKAKKQGAMR